MAAYNKFNAFVDGLAEGRHDLSTNTLRVYLSNTAPNATMSVKADLPEIAPGNGYTAGGNVATATSSSQTGGLYRLVLADPTTWTATVGPIGPFRYAVLYNDSTASDELIAWWDFGSVLSIGAGDSFTVDFDPATGVLTIQ